MKFGGGHPLALLAGPFILGWKNNQELLWALALRAVWGVGFAIQQVVRGRSANPNASPRPALDP